LAAPKTKEEALQQMRLIWVSMIVSILLYVYMSEMVRSISWLNLSHAGMLLVILAICNLYSFLRFQTRRYNPAHRAIQSQPENIQTVRLWMNRRAASNVPR
jgi:hypothetical protein